MTRSQNLAPSVCSIQMQDLLGSVRQDAERDVDRLVANEPIVADLHPDRVEEDQRIAGVERAVLPFGHLVQNRLGYGRDQVRRDVDARRPRAGAVGWRLRTRSGATSFAPKGSADALLVCQPFAWSERQLRAAQPGLLRPCLSIGMGELDRDWHVEPAADTFDHPRQGRFGLVVPEADIARGPSGVTAVVSMARSPAPDRAR
jgi:hypothetical protein